MEQKEVERAAYQYVEESYGFPNPDGITDFKAGAEWQKQKLRWVKASERLPRKPDTYFVRWIDDGKVIIKVACFFKLHEDENFFDVSDEDDQDRKNPRCSQPDEWLEEL